VSSVFLYFIGDVDPLAVHEQKATLRKVAWELAREEIRRTHDPLFTRLEVSLVDSPFAPENDLSTVG
jgi:hypothetical protein